MKIKNTAPQPDTKKQCYVNEMSQAVTCHRVEKIFSKLLFVIELYRG